MSNQYTLKSLSCHMQYLRELKGVCEPLVDMNLALTMSRICVFKGSQLIIYPENSVILFPLKHFHFCDNSCERLSGVYVRDRITLTTRLCAPSPGHPFPKNHQPDRFKCYEFSLLRSTIDKQIDLKMCFHRIQLVPFCCV